MGTTMEEHDAIDDEWMSVPRAAKFLGVSRWTMQELLDNRRIRFYRPSKQPRIRLQDLREYRQRKCRRSRHETRVMENLLAD